MDHNRRSNAVTDLVSGAQAEACRQILQEAEDQCGGVCSANVTNNVNRSEEAGRNQISKQSAFAKQGGENSASVQALFCHRHEKNSADAHQQQMLFGNGCDVAIIGVGKIGIKLQDQQGKTHRNHQISKKSKSRNQQDFGELLQGLHQGGF